MKKNMFVAMLLMIMSVTASAQDCEMQMAVVVDNQLAGIPEESQNVLTNSLERIITKNGMTKKVTFAQFLLTAKVEELDKHVVAGPPSKYVHNLGITLYVVDAISGQKYASTYTEVDGVGNSEQKSYNNAIRNLAPQNGKVVSFMDAAKKKILDYYDKNYLTLIKEAQTMAGMEKYDEALAIICTVPVCSKGYSETMRVGLKIFEGYIERHGKLLLNKAKTVWAANPTVEGAKEVAKLLGQIDPEASCHGEAMQFLQNVQKQTRADLEFETHKKYEDKIELEKHRLDAIRAIGEAYGNGQPKVIVNSMRL
ncbi:MAG: hypothetical protein IKM92_06520 [Bacteroidaceae bacterium]|nr:hypothetical protein [Bacteroidaceae bacterium]